MKKSPAITKSDADGEEEEDYVALIHQESHSRKNDVALASSGGCQQIEIIHFK